jgi:hypothetical protein
MFSNALKLFIFNLPIIVALVKSDGQDIKFQTRQYVEILEIRDSLGAEKKSTT